MRHIYRRSVHGRGPRDLKRRMAAAAFALDPRRVRCITGASDRAGGPAGCPELEVGEERGAAGVKTQAGACCAGGGMDCGARRRRRDSMDSKGSAPDSTAIAGTALARLGILTLDGNHLTPPPIP